MEESQIGAWIVLCLWITGVLYILTIRGIGYFKAYKRIKIGGLYVFEPYLIDGLWLCCDIDIRRVRVKDLKESDSGTYIVEYQADYYPYATGRSSLDYFLEHRKFVEEVKEEEP